MKKQIIFIRGGECFENQEDFYTFLRTTDINLFENRKHWRDDVIEKISDIYEPLVPNMPVRENSDYEAWKIWFERYLNFVYDKNPIFVGTSLGGTFFLKYLSENSLAMNILQLHLIAPCVTDEGQELEKLGTFEFDVTKINKISNICDDIHLWHSKEDTNVPFLNSEIVMKYLPKANLHVFEDKGHFQIESFPELLEVIKQAK
jgi:predicted alpha/beta hydrolase family esterase